MTKNASFLFMASCLSLFVPVSARFAYGLVLVLCSNIILFSVIFLQAFIDYLGIKKHKNLFCITGTLEVTMLLHGTLTIFSPLTAFVLGFVVYMIPVSLFISTTVFVPVSSSLQDAVHKGLKISSILSPLTLLFFTLRELFAYGSLSLPARSGLKVIQIFQNLHFVPTFFWSTIPGALILLAGLLATLSAIYRRYDIKEEGTK